MNQHRVLLEVLISNTPHKDLTIATVQNVLAQTTKYELARYYYDELFITTKKSLLKAVKQVFLISWPILYESIIIKHLYKYINTYMRYLHMKNQWVQSTMMISPDKYISDNGKTNLVFFIAVDPNYYIEDKIYSDIIGSFPILSNKWKR